MTIPGIYFDNNDSSVGRPDIFVGPPQIKVGQIYPHRLPAIELAPWIGFITSIPSFIEHGCSPGATSDFRVALLATGS